MPIKISYEELMKKEDFTKLMENILYLYKYHTSSIRDLVNSIKLYSLKKPYTFKNNTCNHLYNAGIIDSNMNFIPHVFEICFIISCLSESDKHRNFS